MNEFLINPAFAGYYDYSPIMISNRMQWVGIENAPETQIFSAQGPIGNSGIGAIVFRDQNGIFSQSGAQLAYSYRINFGKTQKIRKKSGKVSRKSSMLAFGCAFSGFQVNIDQSDFFVNDLRDPAISGVIETANLPEASCGLFFQNKNLKIGLSGLQLLESRMNLYQREEENNRMQRRILLHAAVTSTINEDFEFEPSFLYNTTTQWQSRLDFNCKLIYHNDYWFAASYSRELNSPYGQNISMKLLTGLKLYRKFYMAYSFEYALSEIQIGTLGSHDLAIFYNMGMDVERKRKIRRR